MTTGKIHRPTCMRCSRVLGDFSEDEYQAFLLSGDLGDLCFDCDPESAATTPSLFWQWQPGDLFTLGEDVFCVADSNPQLLVNVGFSSHAHERARANCLSSSTYLNTTSKNRDAYLNRVRDTMICPECDLGISERMGGAWHCDACGHCEVVESDIILPAWVVKPQIGKAEIKESTYTCFDCERLRRVYGGGYCDYHYTLLAERFEDGELGRENDR